MLEVIELIECNLWVVEASLRARAARLLQHMAENGGAPLFHAALAALAAMQARGQDRGVNLAAARAREVSGRAHSRVRDVGARPG